MAVTNGTCVYRRNSNINNDAAYIECYVRKIHKVKALLNLSMYGLQYIHYFCLFCDFPR